MFMTFSKEYVIMLSLISVISAVCEVMIPSSSLKKAYRFLVCTVMLYAFLLPIIKGGIPDFESIDFDAIGEAYSYTFEEKSQESEMIAYKEGAERVVIEALSEKDIRVKTAEAKCEEVNCTLEIVSINITCDTLNEKEKETVCEVIKGLFNDCKVILNKEVSQ